MERKRLLNRSTPACAEFVAWEQTFRVPQEPGSFVNATSIGLFPDVDAAPDVDTETLLPGMIVADVIPNPPRTAFIRAAEARGCTVLDGLGMLVGQGAISIRHWTGVDPDRRSCAARWRPSSAERSGGRYPARLALDQRRWEDEPARRPVVAVQS